MLFKHILFSVLFSCFSFLALGQEKATFRSVDGTLYKVHIVTKGETLYQISRDFNVEVSQIEKHNSSVKDGLKIGQEILIPVEKESEATVKNDDIKHTVKGGETLFAISRKYDVSPEDIKKWNGLDSDILKIGQVLVIKVQKEDEAPAVINNAPNNLEGEKYIVKKGETLYALSRKFNVAIDDIVKWNSLESQSLSEGQHLTISPKEIMNDPSHANESTQNVQSTTSTLIIDSVKTNTEQPDKEDVEEVVATTPKNKQENEPPQNRTILKKEADDEVDEFVEVVERGVAELIPNTADVNKYLALHRTAKVGTIIRVRNEMNDREIWARVINKLPDTGDNNNVLVKISQAAYNQLGALDKKFRVVVTYIP